MKLYGGLWQRSSLNLTKIKMKLNIYVKAENFMLTKPSFNKFVKDTENFF